MVFFPLVTRYKLSDNKSNRLSTRNTADIIYASDPGPTLPGVHPRSGCCETRVWHDKAQPWGNSVPSLSSFPRPSQMFTLVFWSVLGGLLVLCAFILNRYWRRYQEWLRIVNKIPGPEAAPFVGNVFDIKTAGHGT